VQAAASFLPDDVAIFSTHLVAASRFVRRSYHLTSTQWGSAPGWACSSLNAETMRCTHHKPKIDREAHHVQPRSFVLPEMSQQLIAQAVAQVDASLQQVGLEWMDIPALAAHPDIVRR
jgi:hypothetical protein